jgi:hypothetical protein
MPTVNPATERVPGMAECVEGRRRELGLSPRQFADTAGVTTEALRPVRAGRRKQYRDSVVFGVARALRWEPDWYDRLQAGQDPLISVAPDDLPNFRQRVEQIEATVARLERAIAEVLRRLPNGDGPPLAHPGQP